MVETLHIKEALGREAVRLLHIAVGHSPTRNIVNKAQENLSTVHIWNCYHQ